MIRGGGGRRVGLLGGVVEVWAVLRIWWKKMNESLGLIEVLEDVIDRAPYGKVI